MQAKPLAPTPACTTSHPPRLQALHDLGLRALQLNLDLNSFNERKIKLPDVAALATWPELTRLTLQASEQRIGRSNQKQVSL